ncbi:hypothetical protein SCLCIDRAFT_1207334 [Scleroderma citrinum Foug A]|uniref:Uncharacterized protein n=1 Tax=Scleroderma citrinum Foug A TaxID=1036808 RepID=A0A0C3EPF9_9AGAM|nr:hypothetical protein SCLCIDRAFT_1207334 [Scleroderma citrinum Foug A]
MAVGAIERTQVSARDTRESDFSHKGQLSVKASPHGRRLYSISQISSPYGLRLEGRALDPADRMRKSHSSERLLSISRPMHDESIHHPRTATIRMTSTRKRGAREP